MDKSHLYVTMYECSPCLSQMVRLSLSKLTLLTVPGVFGQKGHCDQCDGWSKVKGKFWGENPLLKCRPNDGDYSFLAFSVGELLSSDPICPTNHWKWVITRSSPLLRTLGNTKNHRSLVFCFCAKMYPIHESFYEMMKCLIDVVRTYDNRISRWYVSTFRTNAMGFITYPPLVHQHTPWLSKVVLFLSLNDFIMLTSWKKEVTPHNSSINHAHTAPRRCK